MIEIKLSTHILNLEKTTVLTKHFLNAQDYVLTLYVLRECNKHKDKQDQNWGPKESQRRFDRAK